jgi:malonyl-CoA O-methyltransferase
VHPADDDVAQAYDAWSEIYDSNANATRDLDAQVLRSQGFDLTGREVLELGCGTGKNTEHLAQAQSVLALDFSDGMLQKARHRIGSQRVRFARHDIRQKLPVPDASFDLVVVNLVLEHVEHLGPVFAEASRSLRPQGLLFVCELHPFRQLLGKQAQFNRPGSGEKVLVTVFQHDVSDFLNAAGAAGLRLVKVEEWRDGEEALKSEPPRLLSITWVR